MKLKTDLVIMGSGMAGISRQMQHLPWKESYRI